MPLLMVRNDITRMPVDAIVNPTDENLTGGGGVDETIRRAAGPELMEACRALGGCATGRAKLTPGFNLPCKYVIHTAGPVWRGGGRGEARLLAGCYESALALAEEYGCASVAFPLISTGTFGYPKAEALQVAVSAITAFLMHSEMTVYIVVYSREAVEVGGKLFQEITAYIDDVYVREHTRYYRESRRGGEARMPNAGAPSPESGGVLRDFFRRRQPRREEDRPAPPTLESLDDVDASYSEEEDAACAPSANLDEMLAQMDEGFAQMLLRKIDERHMTDAECYKRANIDRRLFNKIKNIPDYRPGKQTVLAFAIALRLSLDETREMLMKAGYALSRSSKADIVVEYCIITGNYDIMEINQVLFGLDLQPLGY